MKERFWSEQEIDTVRRMKSEGHKLSWIADHLGRSYDGVRSISRRFKVNPGQAERQSRPWSAREVDYLEAAAERGDCLGTVANHLRRSQSSVKKFAWRRSLALRIDAERDRTKPQPKHWGMVRADAARREQIWARCRFEDDPRACRREPPLSILELGVIPLGLRPSESASRLQPTLPALPSEGA